MFRVDKISSEYLDIDTSEHSDGYIIAYLLPYTSPSTAVSRIGIYVISYHNTEQKVAYKELIKYDGFSGCAYISNGIRINYSVSGNYICYYYFIN